MDGLAWDGTAEPVSLARPDYQETRTGSGKSHGVVREPERDVCIVLNNRKTPPFYRRVCFRTSVRTSAKSTG